MALLLGVALGLAVSACTDPTHPRVYVDEPSTLFDGPLHIHVAGVGSGQRVTIEASTTDVDGARWTSSATFVAGKDGSVDVTSAKPVGGSYKAASATGLLWSMTPGSVSEFFFVPAGDSYTVSLSLIVKGRTAAQTRFERVTAAAGVKQRTVGLTADHIYGVMYEPSDSTARRPAVLVFGGSGGGLQVTGEAAALASHGYPALALAYFGAPGLPDTLANVPLEYFETALRWLAQQPSVNPDRMVVAGISRGSEPALLLGVHYPELVHGVIALVPSSTVFSGLPDTSKPAWTWHGQPLPSATARPGYRVDNEAAVIPVERIRGPVFLLCGRLDALWPSCSFADAITERLAANGFGYPVVSLAEPDSGHFVGATLPNLATSSGFVTSPRYGRLNVGGNQEGDALARLDAWPRLLAFLAAL